MRPLISMDEQSVQSMFPLPSLLIETRGSQEGIILKFKTFYLKLYDGLKEDTYTVKGFRYHAQNPVFEADVRTAMMRKFAAQFNHDDYLMGWTPPCDDPNCILQGNQEEYL